MSVKAGWLFPGVCLLLFSLAAQAGDLRITIPKRTKPTPVQSLNRDGVKAIKKHDYRKARRLFYKAYLLDPNDPFTLNNLGYLAELDGEVDRAQRYYELAAAHQSEAVVERATTREIEGRNVASVAGHAEEGSMQVNRLNVEALGLLQKDRAPEADLVLQRALGLDRHNPFTLNNLGYAKEKQGELEAAFGYYQQAANAASEEPIVVTVNKDWRGKAISQVAEKNARKVRQAMRQYADLRSQVALLNLRGVSALNRNDRRGARNYFEQAYRLNPQDSFTLNNMGYVAELDGDRETANFYYDKAREAERADARVTVASRRDAEGKRLQEVASQNNTEVESSMQAELLARRRMGGTPRLKRRDRTVVVEPPAPNPANNEQPK